MKKPPEGGFGVSWWSPYHSNKRHKDFQSSALPTAFGRFEALESIPAIGHFSTQSGRLRHKKTP